MLRSIRAKFLGCFSYLQDMVTLKNGETDIFPKTTVRAKKKGGETP